MLMSVVDDLRQDAIYPELAGARVLITGATSRFGVDIARAFAEHRCQIVLQTPETSPEMAEVEALLAQSATALQVYETILGDADETVRFVQGPAQKAFGGLEIAVNLVPVNFRDLTDMAELSDFENFIANKLLGATMAGRIAANRMRLTLTEGSIFNVIVAPNPATPAEATLVELIRATLAAITRGEAAKWADQSIRINAVAPCAPTQTSSDGRYLTSEPDIAALALYLASRKGAKLSGHVFDTAGLSSDHF